MIIIVNTRMPQTDSCMYSGFAVKIRAKAEGSILDSRNITDVKQMHSSRTQRIILQMRSCFPAPRLKLISGWLPPVIPNMGDVIDVYKRQSP